MFGQMFGTSRLETKIQNTALTDNSEVDLAVPRRRVLEVHPTPVHPLVLQLYVVDDQGGGRGGGAEERPLPEDGGRRPELRLVELPPPHVETEKGRYRDRAGLFVY